MAKNNPSLHLKNLPSDDFLGNAVHELKSPLASIKIFTQLLQKYLSSTPDQRVPEYLAKIDSKVNSLTSLIEDLSDVIRIQHNQFPLSFEVFDLNTLIHEIAVKFGTSTDHPLIFENNTDQIVLADRGRIAQAITNLISHVSTSSSGQITIHTISVQNGVQFTIHGFSSPISPPDSEKIFEPFHKLKNSPANSGLGLHISSQIIKLHSGRIWVDSQSGHSFSFHFFLPSKPHR